MARRPPFRVGGAKELVGVGVQGVENQRPGLGPGDVAQQYGRESLLTDSEGQLLVP